MSASELLAQYGITFQQARDFIHNNLNSPAIIYSTAAQYGITFDMLGELYADGVSGAEVKSFFSSKGYSTENNMPIMMTTPIVPDDLILDDLDLTLDSVLNLSDEEIQNSDWNTLITDYQTALMNFNWSAWGNNIEEILSDYDWAEWAQELEEMASNLATDNTWLNSLATFYSDVYSTLDLSSLFSDDLWQWDDSSENSFDLNKYLDLLTNLGINEELLNTYFDQLADMVNLDAYLEQLQAINFDDLTLGNFDWINTYLGDLDLSFVNQQSVELTGISEADWSYT